MNKLLLVVPFLVRFSLAGESALTITYQPLNGLGSGTIRISQVTCHDWYSHSGQATQISLISAPNIPPTNNPKEATENLNLASVCGVRFWTSDLGIPTEPLVLTMDLSQFSVPQRFEYPREDIIRACLECLRRCLPDRLQKTPLTLECREIDSPWLTKIVSDFNAHDRSKVFFIPDT